MKELVFNIKNIFSVDKQNGCLGQYGVKRYHIPAYQRGYKWSSKQETDAVPTLIRDLWEAFTTSKASNRKEYYMQYITVKNIDNIFLEVIDGQQRLTTFSILLSIFHLLEVDSNTNYSEDKLEYAIREDFFNNHIYDKQNLQKFINEDWSEIAGIKLDGNDINKQDIYYLHSASKYIYTYLTEVSRKSDISSFTQFVLEYVKIIVNEIEPHIDSEKVFRNLNSNKVPLTEAELIKGLLLTKAVRKHNDQDKQKSFKEMLEMRTSLGRQWDEISTWINEKKVKHFFFSKTNEPYEEKIFNDLLLEIFKDKPEKLSDEKSLFLLLISMTFKKDLDIKESKYLLFNYFHVLSKKKDKCFELLVKLKQIYCILKDWYQNDNIYNHIGFCFFSKDSKEDRFQFIIENLYQSKKGLLDSLIDKRNLLIPADLTKLRYGVSDAEIHRVLLALSVFKYSSDKNDLRFDFYGFTCETWSLEHIFPQKPEGEYRKKVHVLTDDEKEEIKEMLGEFYTVDIEILLKKPQRTDEEKDIYYSALQKSGINVIGNMALLTMPDNSSNGCAMFELKRTNVNFLIQTGSFVPKHTFEIFNKVVLDSSITNKWTKMDTDLHFNFINTSIEKIKSMKLS